MTDVDDADVSAPQLSHSQRLIEYFTRSPNEWDLGSYLFTPRRLAHYEQVSAGRD
jgi:hypothetical protein